jgi:phenylalanyl-tRNA synthetase beta chain
MNISYDWLSQYVDVSCGVETLAAKLTMAGIEVEAIERSGGHPEGIVVGEILERKPHPDADKLSVCRVSDGKDELQIVCGAPNCDAGNKVPLATIGATLTDKASGESFKIKKSKLRGVESLGMLCSSRELGMDDDHSGLMILDSTLKTGTPLTEVFPGDTMFELEVTPNRPDWLSHWGVARDLACLLDKEAALPVIKAPVPAKHENSANLVTVLDKELCPRYTARVIRNVKIAESPEWLKKRLLSIGLRPINNVVDITNFVLMELGHPLHAFDLDKLSGRRIVVRRANAGEKMTMLDGKEYTLKPCHLVIADAEKPMALAGVMGGMDSGVVESTVNVLLESAAFFTSNIRATSRELGISSDSSYRFERGIDWNMVETASDRATALILELAGGELVTGLVDVQGCKPEFKPVTCRFERIRKLTGVDLNNSRIVDIFKKLRLGVSEIDDVKCVVTPPSFRLDIEREADLAEEVARVNGLDAVPVVPVTAKTVAPYARDAYAATEQLRNELIALGVYECLHYSTVSDKSALLDPRFVTEDVVRMDNPLSLDLNCLRPSLLGEMLATVERNISRQNLNLQLFEMGRVFCGNPQKFPEERIECCVVLTGRKRPERFSAERGELFDFYDLKGLVEAWFTGRKISKFRFEKADDARFAPGRCAAVLIDGKGAGHIGELNTKYSAKFRTEYPIFLGVFETSAILKAKPESLLYSPLAAFPSTTRDVAFIADQSLQHQAVVDFIRSARLKNLEKVELFDIFIDDKAVGAGRKSMAYTLTFRSSERTLTDKEVNESFDKLREKLSSDLKVELR